VSARRIVRIIVAVALIGAAAFGGACQQTGGARSIDDGGVDEDATVKADANADANADADADADEDADADADADANPDAGDGASD
jgi:hypothetical protein